MSPERDFLEDMLDGASLVQSYAAEITRSDLATNVEKQDSIIRRLAVIGEAASKVPDAIRAEFPDIPWKSIIGMRNILIHQYWEIDFDELWLVIHRDLPVLIAAVEKYRSADR